MALAYNMKITPSSESKQRIWSTTVDQRWISNLENAKFIDGHDLFTYFLPRYNDRNKKALLDDLILNKKYIPSKKQILISRFIPRSLPDYYTYENHVDSTKSYEFLPDVFDYKPIGGLHTIEWYMNFANHDIFAYYHSSLLAQDELQVLECPQLASLREFLLKQNRSTDNGDQPFDPHVIEGNSPYPILIGNVERAIELNTTNLYGHKFSTSSESTVLSSYTYLDSRQIINLIAIEAPKYGSGFYTHKQIEYILQACFTAYSAARALANTIYNLKTDQLPRTPLKTYVHTGWFGCGAYGGDRTIMIILQILAAKMAGIDKLIFHTVTNDCDREIKSAKSCLENLLHRGQNKVSMNELIKRLIDKGFQWGASNGT
ncbi:unnamed protein product [Adineta ricciae]|uniref:PARG catalytic Macro domain-containing protein n=1 Tax=Adineta ricciae TaxID=249248 RepID=A0A815QPU5_ADIRI|nr:unnamed protein product [Adineta ricciae]CAF1466321.1 unnamed protein product [Adineta ricciae]